jgi:hypothetical protein
MSPDSAENDSAPLMPTMLTVMTPAVLGAVGLPLLVPIE